jgi:hypothetical protein
MTVTASARRPSAAARRVGYVLAAVINAGLLVLVNTWPGWEAVPFLTADTNQVIGLVNATLIASTLANLVYVAADPPWLKNIGDLITTGIGLASTVRMWQVFPFDFADSWINWALLARILLVVAIVGSIIGIIVQIVSLARWILGGGTRCEPATAPEDDARHAGQRLTGAGSPERPADHDRPRGTDGSR